MPRNTVPIGVLMQYFRVPAGEIPVDYPGRQMLLGSRITNISTTGVFIRTSRPLPRDSHLEFVFRLPGSSRDIRAKGIVRWASESKLEAGDVESPGGMGIEFTDLLREDKKCVERYVRDFLARMRGIAGS